MNDNRDQLYELQDVAEIITAYAKARTHLTSNLNSPTTLDAQFTKLMVAIGKSIEGGGMVAK